MVDEFGPVDLTTWLDTPYQQQTLAALFGRTTFQRDPARYREATPLFGVSPQSAPMLIIQGTRDTVVSPQQSQALAQALQQEQVPVEYVSYAGDHEYQGISPAQQQVVEIQRLAFLLASD